jgi:branched-chain amino acid transport system permease protein
VRGTYALAFGISLACVAVAGVVMSPIYAIQPLIGQSFIGLVFIIVVFGGVRSLVGTVIAAFVMAGIEVCTSFFWSSDLKDALMFATFIVILLVKPSGLMGMSLRRDCSLSRDQREKERELVSEEGGGRLRGAVAFSRVE